VEILQTIFQLNIFSNLQDIFFQIICENPEKLINSSNFHNLDKFTFIQLLKSDNLNMEEVKIWNHLLDWATSNIQDNLNIKEVENWESKDFELLKDILVDFVPHIRWFQILGKDFVHNVKPLKEALPEELYDDLVNYNIDRSIELKSSVILPKRNKPSVGILCTE
jgi:methyltransferase-like protein